VTPSRIFCGLTLLLATTCASAQPTTDFVILISVDGLHAGHLAELMANDLVGDFASFQRFVDEGASTFNARTDYTHTNTSPNHTCMLTGRPVLQPAGMANTVHHGYTNNSTPAPTATYHTSGNPNLSYVASVFDVVHDHGLRTGCYISKPKLLIIDQSYGPTTGGLDLVLPDDGRDKIDAHVLEADIVLLNAALVADLNVSPAHFSFVHYNQPDLMGHEYGWGSASWDDAVRRIDDRLEELFAAVENIPTLVGHTTIILTADHGGIGTAHSDVTSPDCYTIPFFVWGPDVPAGVDLYAMNRTTRLVIGSSQPTYHGGYQPIRTGDAGNLALDLLNLPAIPGSIINADQDLIVDEVPTGRPEAGLQPTRLSVFPNPSSPDALFEFTLPNAGRTRLEIYDAAGRRLRTAVDGWYPAGAHSFQMDAADLASGTYFARLVAGGHVVRRKFMIRR
jgi:hypothetical protein